MHENALLSDLRCELESIARRSAAVRFRVVSLWMGCLCHVEESTLRARWPATVEGTAAAGAELRIERSNDPADPRAQQLVLKEVVVTEAP